MVHGPDGNVLDVRRKTRVIPPAIRRALDARDGGCRFPGCGLKICDAHHLQHWADGGETKLSNFMKQCRRHHYLLHERGFRVEALPHGEFGFYWPDGTPILEAPVLPRVEVDPVFALMDRNSQEGLEIDSRTSMPGWDGTPPNLDYAMSVLYPSEASQLPHQ